ncbi:MAG: hypothetical protein ACM30I_14820 [Gemmatimonas sp.]
MPSDDPVDAVTYTVEVIEDDAMRVLARATDAAIAHAMFRAACGEYPNGRIVLKRGADIIAESTNRRSA